MATVGADGDPAKAKQAGLALGSFLRDLGFHLDLAPVADVKPTLTTRFWATVLLAPTLSRPPCWSARRWTASMRQAWPVP